MKAFYEISNFKPICFFTVFAESKSATANELFKLIDKKDLKKS